MPVTGSHTSSTLLDKLVQEEGNNIVAQMSRISNNLVDLTTGLPKESNMPRLKNQGKAPIKVVEDKAQIYLIRTKRGGVSSLGMTRDGAARREGKNIDVAAGQTSPRLFEGNLEFGSHFLKINEGSSSRNVKYLAETLKTFGEQLGAHIASLVAGSTVGLPIVDVALSASSFDITDVSKYREGEKFDVYLNNAYSHSFIVKTIDVKASTTSPIAPTYTIGLLEPNPVAIPALSNPAIVKIYPSGAGGEITTGVKTAFTSMSDIFSGAALYGLSLDEFPSGMSFAAAPSGSLGSWDNVTGRAMSDLVRKVSGAKPSHLLCSLEMASAIVNQQLAQRRFTSGDVDVYGGTSNPMFDELPIVTDEAISPDKVIWFNKDYIELRQAYPFGFIGSDGMSSGTSVQKYLRNAENSHKVMLHGTGSWELVVERRRAFAELTNLARG